MKEVSVWGERKIKLLTFAETTENAVTLSHPLHCQSARGVNTGPSTEQPRMTRAPSSASEHPSFSHIHTVLGARVLCVEGLGLRPHLQSPSKQKSKFPLDEKARPPRGRLSQLSQKEALLLGLPVSPPGQVPGHQPAG